MRRSSDESWRDIPGYPGYQASSEGRIRSVDREWWQASKRGTKYLHKMKGRILRAAPSRSGHLTLVPGRSAGTTNVHTLVALAFLGARPEGMEVMHLDEDETNNASDNLQYGTRGQNMKSAWAAGKRVVHPNFIGARWRKRA
jgi:HNH endonuclease/NUMOD4 motif